MINALEQALNSLLQKKISFSINNKTIKDGQLILFNIKDYYITFILYKKDKKKVYEIPVPFDFTQKKTEVVFDYSIKHICKTNMTLNILTNLIKSKLPKTSKFYDAKIIIRCE